MKSVLTAFLICIISCALMTCAEHPEINNPNPNNPVVPGQKLTPEQRRVVLNEAKDFSILVGDLTTDQSRQALLTWLKVNPAFEEAGIAHTTVWARFYDATIVMFVPDWESAADPGGRTAFDPLAGRSGGSYGGRAEKLPGFTKGTLFHGHGSLYFKNDTGYLKEMFERSNTGKNAGYTIDTLRATIDNLMKVRDLGIFFIDTHGGMGKTRFTVQPDIFGIWTCDPMDSVGDLKYEKLLESNQLVFMCASYDYQRELHYAFTHRFVAKGNMTFANDAFLYIDACSSLKPGETDGLVIAMTNAAANHKATYIGWTDSTTGTEARPTARYVLAAHDNSVQPGVLPPQRPFDWPSIFKRLKEDHYGVSVVKGELDYRPLSTTTPMLRPSISYIFMADYESKMVVYGQFGEDPGPGGREVTVDGVPATNIFWTPSFIMCDISQNGKGSFGDVRVTVRGVDSNAVPLSMWTIPLKLSVNDMGITTETNLQLKIRADVHPYRLVPYGNVTTVRPDSLGLLKDEKDPGWKFNNESTGSFSVGGERRATCTIEGCTVRDTESALKKSGSLPYKPLTEGHGFRAYYKWAEDMRTLYVRVSATVTEVQMTLENYGKCPDKDESRLIQNYASALAVQIPTVKIKQLEFKLDEDFNIIADNISDERLVSWGRCPESDTKVVTTATWSAASPEPKLGDKYDARVGM